MHRAQEQVREFHRVVTGQPTSPAEPRPRNPELRAKLILEEALETVEALVGTKRLLDLIAPATSAYVKREMTGAREPNLVEVLDGLCDTIVVCYGTAEDIGVDLEPFYDEVCRSNLAKAGGALREDGKFLKPPGWTPPDIKRVLARARKSR